jgi:hypothetical protein
MSQRDQRDQRDSDGTLSESHAPRLPQWPLRSAPTPPYRPLSPMSPTPVVTASATVSSTDSSASLQGTPLRKLRDARRASTGMPPHTSLHPDGTPAPLPTFGPGGSGLIGRGRARVVQRFTGSGVVPRTRLQRQEGHARRATVALAAVAAVLIAGSALLLFDPAIQRPGFGFSLGQILHRRPSGAPLYVDGTQPPTTTPTPTASAQTPTPTPPGGANTGAGTPVPTATPRPTVPPTPIPTVIPGGAVISFKPTTQPVSHSSFTGCAPPTACDFLTSSNSGSSPGSAVINTTGSVSDEVAGPYNVTLTAVRYCYYPIPDFPKCVVSGHSWDPAAWGNPTFNMQSSNFSCSGISIPAVGVKGTVPSSWCWWPTSWNPVLAGTFTGTLAQDEPVCTSCNFYLFSFSFSNAQWNSVRSHAVVTGADCNNAADAAYAQASTSATSTLNAWVAGRPRLAAQVTQIASARGCTPGVNAASGTTTGSSAASWSATVLDPNTAVAGAASYIKNHVPPGYSLTGGPTTCTAQSLLSASNYSYDSGTGVVTITCPSSGTATYDWVSATQGKGAQDSLKSALAGKPLAAALDLCNGRVTPYATGYPGIQPGTCTITLSGGNVSVVPDASKLQIIPQ